MGDTGVPQEPKVGSQRQPERFLGILAAGGAAARRMARQPKQLAVVKIGILVKAASRASTPFCIFITEIAPDVFH